MFNLVVTSSFDDYNKGDFIYDANAIANALSDHPDKVIRVPASDKPASVEAKKSK